MSRLARFVPVGGAVLLLTRLLACSSSQGGGTTTTTAGSGGSSSTATHSSTTGTGGQGTGGAPAFCNGSPCPVGPSTCDGNTVVTPVLPCDPTTLRCVGAVQMQMTPCLEGAVCNAGACLTRVAPPAKACAVATDCGLPPTVCVESADQIVYSDPSCNNGQCHWKQTVLECGNWGAYCDPANGSCQVNVPMETAAPPGPNPQSPLDPPIVPAAQTCTTAADCTQPAPTCFSASVVTYVSPTCQAGSCVWEMSLSQCAKACFQGACAAAQCTQDADCAPWPPTCHTSYPGSTQWYVESCATPTCQMGSCQCNTLASTMCSGTSCTNGVCGP